MRNIILLGILSVVLNSLSAQKTILIDGNYEDWDQIEPVFVDDTGDGQNNGIDIKRVWAHNDQNNIYFRFELTKEINLQEDNDFAIYIDFDHDISTGFKINGIGAELRYFFGERFGVIDQGGDFEYVNFVHVGMLVAPSVSSTEFEIAIQRRISDSGIFIEAENEISFRLEDNSFNGDEAPSDLFGIEYEIDETNLNSIPPFDLDRAPSADFRFMSYNIENDQLFDPSRKNAFERIFQSIVPDIIALQEVRDFDSEETKEIIEDFFPGETWFHKKHGFDIVTISKYPINFSERVDGNAAFFLDVDGQEIVLINCHLPCCENDSERQEEVDIIMEYIRDLKNGIGNYSIEEGTPIIIAGDMNFVGDSNQPYTFFTGDIFANGFYGPDFAPDWDDSELKDANPYATNSFGNFTWLNLNGSFFPGKLDWIYYTDSRISLENTFGLYTPALNSDVLDEYNLQSGDVLFASDHLPIVADFAYSVVSVDDMLEIDISLYPNPAADFINIEIAGLDILRFKVLDQFGQRIIQQNPSLETVHKIDISTLSSGAYILLIETESGKIARSFLKVR